jgi:hypothetical protein
LAWAFGLPSWTGAKAPLGYKGVGEFPEFLAEKAAGLLTPWPSFLTAPAIKALSAMMYQGGKAAGIWGGLPMGYDPNTWNDLTIGLMQSLEPDMTSFGAEENVTLPYINVLFNYSSVSFPSMTSPSSNNSASNQLNGIYNVSIDTNANYKIQANGTDFTGAGNIPIGNHCHQIIHAIPCNLQKMHYDMHLNIMDFP